MTDKNQPLIAQDTTQHPPPSSSTNPYYNPNNFHNSGHNQSHQGYPPQYNYPNQNVAPPPPQEDYLIPGPILNHPQIIIIREQMSFPCPMCGCHQGYIRKTAGCAIFSWCITLFCFTGLFCFWIPFVIDRCWDIQIVCSQCHYIKAIMQANCC